MWEKMGHPALRLLRGIALGTLVAAPAAGDEPKGGSPSAPLSISSRIAQPQIPQNQKIVIAIEVTIVRRFTMESIELNRDRTQIQLTDLTTGVKANLSGIDYIRLHPGALGAGPMAIGREVTVEAGEHWISELKLSDYSPPLKPGRYRIQISYRYGETEAQKVVSNPVELSIVKS